MHCTGYQNGTYINVRVGVEEVRCHHLERIRFQQFGITVKARSVHMGGLDARVSFVVYRSEYFFVLCSCIDVARNQYNDERWDNSLQ